MSHSTSAESERLRIGDDLARAEESRAPGPVSAGSTSFVGSVAAGAAAGYAEVIPQDVAGTETQGTAGSYTSSGASVFALNLGATSPGVGTKVVVTWVDYRWVFRHD